MDDVHAVRIDARVAAHDVIAHAVGDSHNRARGLVGGLLHVGGQTVAASELLGLPRTQRLERVGGDNVWNIPEE